MHWYDWLRKTRQQQEEYKKKSQLERCPECKKYPCLGDKHLEFWSCIDCGHIIKKKGVANHTSHPKSTPQKRLKTDFLGIKLLVITPNTVVFNFLRFKSPFDLDHVQMDILPGADQAAQLLCTVYTLLRSNFICCVFFHR